MNLINTLRMYAEDMHSATGYSERSSAMSKAAYYIERLEKELAEWKNMSACEACATIPSVMEYVQQLEQERDTLIQAVADHVTARCELSAQNVALKDALQDCVDMPKSHAPTRKAVLLLNNLPNLAEEVLKRRDAETLRRAADRFE